MTPSCSRSTFAKKTLPVVKCALRILEAEHPVTLRQLFYRVVSGGTIPNTIAAYRRLGRLTGILREDGTVPVGWIVDHLRQTLKPSSWSGLADFGDSVRDSYRKDFWAQLPECVEIVVEKDSVAGAIQAATERFDVALRPCRGYASTSFCEEIGAEWRAIKKPLFVGYIGDHDPSGRDIERSLQEKLEHYSGRPIVSRSIFDMLPAESQRRFVAWQRLAVNPSDFGDFDLIPLPAKSGDPRHAAFIADHGPDCAEVEALPPNELRLRVESAILSHIDSEAWARLEAVEAAERETMAAFIDAWSER